MTRRIACTEFICGCARRCSRRRITCTGFIGGCARRCSPHRIACTCFFGGCARRCSTSHIACTCFFGGCEDTLRPPSSQCILLPPPRPLPPHAVPSLPVPCWHYRTKDSSLLHSPLFPCLETLLACVWWSLPASCFRPTSLTTRPLFCRLAPPSIACVAKAMRSLRIIGINLF